AALGRVQRRAGCAEDQRGVRRGPVGRVVRGGERRANAQAVLVRGTGPRHADPQAEQHRGDSRRDEGDDVVGQKTHPYGFRLGIIKPWRSRWYAGKTFAEFLKEDELIRKYLKTRLAHAAVSDVHVERKPGKVTVTVFTGRPGVVIGKRGAEIARTEGYHEGRVPLHTLRADVDYAQGTAKTTYGTIGVKVWIFKGEVVDDARGRTYSTGS